MKKLLVEPNYKGLGPVFRQNANKVAEAIRQQDGREIYKELSSEKAYLLTLNGEEYKITDDMVSFREEMPDNYAAGSFDEGKVYVDMTIPKELAQEGFVQETVRRLQEMRKRLDLPVDAFVEAYVTVPDGEKLEWLEDERGYLMEEAGVKTLQLLRPGEAKPKAQMEEQWQIDGQSYHMGMSQVN